MSRFHPSAFYFIYFGALAALAPFLALYYQQLGFSGSQIGILLGVSPLITLVASPFWTGYADANQRHKPVLLGTLLSIVLLAFVFPLVRSFPVALVLVTLMAFMGAPVVSLVDSATLSMLGERRNEYGRIRLWGSVGWGLTAPIVGWVFQRFQLVWMFYIYASFMALNLFTTGRMTFPKQVSSTPFWRGLRSLFSDRQWVLFLLLVFVAGIGNAAHTSYMSLLMSQLGADKTLMGIALTLSTLSEVPVMFFSSILLKRFSPRGLLAIALFFSGLRCILYAFVGNAAGVLAIQAIHGLTFPILWIAGVTYAAENAPEGLGATAQGLFGGVLMGFGMAAGSLLGGMLIDSVGISGMYAFTGALVLLSLALSLFLGRQKKAPLSAS